MKRKPFRNTNFCNQIYYALEILIVNSEVKKYDFTLRNFPSNRIFRFLTFRSQGKESDYKFIDSQKYFRMGALLAFLFLTAKTVYCFLKTVNKLLFGIPHFWLICDLRNILSAFSFKTFHFTRTD